MKKHYVFSLILICSVLLSGYLGVPAEDKGPKIKFSHKTHITEAEAECSACHATISGSKLASDRNQPSHEQCIECHDDLEEETKCKMCHVDPENPEPIPHPERTFLFNHSFHLKEQKLTCDKCHSGIEKLDIAFNKALPPKQTCIECHSDEIEINVCRTCHKDVAAVFPHNHLGNWKLSHKIDARSGQKECSVCHSADYCQECHSGGALVTVTESVITKTTEMSPEMAGRNKQVLNRMHGLNYRAVHAQDAKMKVFECATCHETKKYCQECHESMGLKPLWHSGTGWGAIAGAVGSGGGRHAELAKKDISVCASCHDVEGNDPVCLMCHRDASIGKDNDPKTHERGSYKNEKGPWHEDQAYICFNCHTSTMKSGVGFCGYCHR